MPTVLVRPLAPLATSLMLTACSVATPPSLAPAARPPAPVTSVRLDLPAQADPATARFTAALGPALARHGVAVAADSAMVLTLALSQRPAALGVTRKPGEAWLSLPRKRALLDSCSAQRLSVRLMARDEARAEPAFVASGGFDYCRLDPADLDALAEQFAAALAQG